MACSEQPSAAKKSTLKELEANSGQHTHLRLLVRPRTSWAGRRYRWSPSSLGRRARSPSSGLNHSRRWQCLPCRRKQNKALQRSESSVRAICWRLLGLPWFSFQEVLSQLWSWIPELQKAIWPCPFLYCPSRPGADHEGPEGKALKGEGHDISC